MLHCQENLDFEGHVREVLFHTYAPMPEPKHARLFECMELLLLISLRVNRQTISTNEAGIATLAS